MADAPQLRAGDGYFGPAHNHEPVETFPEPGRTIYGAAVARAKAELSGNLIGVTSDGVAAPALFPRRSTGVSLAPVIAAARAFRDSLDAGRRGAVQHAIDDDHHWRAWHNMHPNLMRHGVCLFDLTSSQREAALELVRQTMSASGFANTRGVMQLNGYIGELTGRHEEFGEWYYFISLFGEPSSDEPWGWQLDGHHLIINCFALGDQLVLTPHFSGSEPLVAESGPYAGTRVFAEEEARGFRLMQALTPQQQATARIGMDLPRDVLAGAGIPYAQLADEQRALLLDVIGVYVGRIRPGHDAVRMEEVMAHLDATWFAWIGACDEHLPFYYRVHSPVILIEFDHIPGVIYDNAEPTRRHVHTIVRTPNGNDYGADLLRRHYLEHDHEHPHSPHRLGRV